MSGSLSMKLLLKIISLGFKDLFSFISTEDKTLDYDLPLENINVSKILS